MAKKEQRLNRDGNCDDWTGAHNVRKCVCGGGGGGAREREREREREAETKTEAEAEAEAETRLFCLVCVRALRVLVDWEECDRPPAPSVAC